MKVFEANVRVFNSTSLLFLTVDFSYVNSKPLIMPCLLGRNISLQSKMIVVDVTSLTVIFSGGAVGTKKVMIYLFSLFTPIYNSSHFIINIKKKEVFKYFLTSFLRL